MDAKENEPVAVQVQIKLARQDTKFKEVIKHTTKRHELVEVDGFNFRRKRRAVLPSPAQERVQAQVAKPANVAAELAQAPDEPSNSPAIKHGLQFQGSSPVPATPAHKPSLPAAATDADAEAQAPLDENTEAVVAGAAAGGTVADPEPHAEAQTETETAIGELASPQPLQFSIMPSELCYLVEWVLVSELKKLPGMTADTAQAAAAILQQQFALQLQQRQGVDTDSRAAGSGQDEGLAQGSHMTVLPYHVEQLKAVLQQKHSRLLEEEFAWLQLLQQYKDMEGTQSSDNTAVGSEQDNQAWGSGDNTANAATKAEAVSNKEIGADADMPDAAEAQPGSTKKQQQQHLVVSGQQESTMRGVQLKVEVLSAMVSKMEHLVRTAEVAARTLQMGYHAETFKVFPQVNSPAALIKDIVSSQAMVGNGGITPN